MAAEVIIHPVEHPWCARFHQDLIWNQELAGMYQRTWTELYQQCLDDNPRTLATPYRLFDVVLDGRCIFSMPLYQNEIGEWSDFSINGGYGVPYPELKRWDWFAPDLHCISRAFEIAQEEGYVLDLVNMCDVTSMGSNLRSLPGFTSGVINHAIMTSSAEDYISQHPSSKFRKNTRRMLTNTKALGYAYVLQDGSTITKTEKFGWLYQQWWEWYGNVPGSHTYDIGILREIAQQPDSQRQLRIYGIFRGDNLVGVDVLFHLGVGGWMSRSTIYDVSLREEEVGNFAMLALIQEGSSVLHVPDVIIGADHYGEDYSGDFDNRHEYKRRWATHTVPSFGVGLGMWENRNSLPKIPLRTYAHLAICAVENAGRIGLVVKSEDPDGDPLMASDMYPDEREMLPSEWDTQEYLEWAWSSLLRGAGLPWITEERRLYELMVDIFGKEQIDAHIIQATRSGDI